MIDARDVVLNILLDIEINNTFSNIAVSKALKKNQFESKTDRAFITRLAEGVVESQIKLDYIIDMFSKVPAEKCKPLIRSILRMGVYQVMYMEKVPDNAACSEAVKLARKHNFMNLTGFVNGILRNVIRNKDDIKMPDKSDFINYLSVNYSTPKWICGKLIKDYGDSAEAILSASFDERKTSIRVNTLKTTKEELIRHIKEELGNRSEEEDKTDLAIEDGIYDENALLISRYDFIRNIPGYRQGLFFVQDESSMCAVGAAGIKAGDTVVDVCAAPGGKSMCALTYMNGSGKVYARDISDDKLLLIEENAERLGVSSLVDIKKWDANETDESLIQNADVVIADLPCSGLGIMGRKNDIKYRVTQNQTDELVCLQRDILSVVKQYVKEGGRLLYSTCTINPQENGDNAKWFIENNNDFKLVCEKQFVQGIDKCDGFYYAVFQRVK